MIKSGLWVQQSLKHPQWLEAEQGPKKGRNGGRTAATQLLGKRKEVLW